MITTPFRVFLLLLSFYLIYSSMSSQADINKEKVLTANNYFFLCIYAVYVLKIFFDLYFDEPAKAGQYYWTTEKYLWFVMIPGVLTIILTIRYIDYALVLKMALFVCFFGNVASLFNMNFQGGQNMGRMQIGENIQLLNSISLGQFGTSAALLGISQWNRKSNIRIFKIFIGILIILGLILIAKAGSRGPIISMAVPVLVYISARQKNPLFGFIVCGLVGLLGYLFIDYIFQLISYISPVLENRFQRTLLEGDLGREQLFNDALQEFYKYPLGGGYFMVPYRCYSHNMILDAFMTFGIFGGCIFAIMLLLSVVHAYKVMHAEYSDSQWISLIFLQFLCANMTSGAFYINMPLIATIIILFTLPILSRNDLKTENR
ncbi:O-antigen ligase family protein [Victivallis sp. Marseille-Q1083]|uniref:O-antigen ligase family protein n=1 Tax=Victivallis sp. Marseille-Q1083 TaxID=2717288 RepID=UPI00158F2DA4|nr:O-antigen ligase family protein [Victivallis sp. Marseille-Q1083]